MYNHVKINQAITLIAVRQVVISARLVVVVVLTQLHAPNVPLDI